MDSSFFRVTMVGMIREYYCNGMYNNIIWFWREVTGKIGPLSLACHLFPVDVGATRAPWTFG